MSCCVGTICNDLFGCCHRQIPSDAAVTSINKQRSCTDKLLFILYCCSWGASIYIITYCIANGGSVQRLLHGTDMQGNTCGDSANPYTYNLPYNVMPNPIFYNYTVCVQSCDITNDASATNTPMSILYPSNAIGDYCIPDFNSISNSTGFTDTYTDANSAVNRSIADLYTSWPMIAASVGICIVIGLVFTVITRYFTGIFIWACILTIISGGFLSAYFFYTTAQQQDNVDRATAYKYTGITVAALDAVFLLIVFALRKRIAIAIEVIKESSVAITDMLSILSFPIIPLVLMLGYTVWFIYVALYLFSTSTLVINNTAPPYEVTHKLYGFDDTQLGQSNNNIYITTTATYEYNNTTRYLAAYHIFHALWTLQWIIYFSYTVIAGTVGDWYFTRTDGSGNKIRGSEGLSYFALTASVYRTIRYHMGTISFASLIIAMIEFARAIVSYVERNTRGKNGQPNRLQRAVFCMVQTLLACCQYVADKVSSNALIYTAITGDSFCSAAAASFALLARNLLRVAAINVVSTIILLIGKLTVTGITIGISALALTRMSMFANQLTSAYVPLIVIAVLAYSVATVYFSIFNTTIDTIFMCFLFDCEHNNNDTSSMLATPTLQHLVGKYADQSEQEAQQLQQRAYTKNKQLNNDGNVIQVKPYYQGNKVTPVKQAQSNYIG